MNCTARYLTLTIAACLAVVGCKKDDDASASADAAADAPSGLLGQAATAAKADAAVAALPKPDLARPLTDYEEVNSGKQLMFLYLAASKLPPDYSKVAEAFSSEYRSTEDSFRRNDLLKALQPQMEARVATAAQQPYGWMEVDKHGTVDAYDFKRGGFPISEFSGDTTRYFGDESHYRLSWGNHDAVSFAPVSDESVAREIEAMRGSYDTYPRLKVYFLAQSADLDKQEVKAYVTRVQITDANGRIMAEYGPNPAAAAAAAAAR